ncbi:MAG: serine O-acetyltransferase [Symploca sp. SIO3C6]|nr:serine O-acetyltransferase [Symploca sp. SIO3C6]NET05815.1 serine O-acetyltransferase [Symploca sp. SIO2B6]
MLQPISSSATARGSTLPDAVDFLIDAQASLPKADEKKPFARCPEPPDFRVKEAFKQSLATIYKYTQNTVAEGLQALWSDFQIIFERDPAARNWLEVLLCYPGLHALVWHRFAHWLNLKRLPIIPRLISALARFLTGIDIHPGAVIGKGVFIDHGMGVVIGETAIVGDYALIYQGVTLGGTGKESGKRHPTLGKNVVVSAGVKVLGNIQIGDNVRIGAGSIVLQDVPPDCTVVGIPGRIVRRLGQRLDPLDHGKLPDTQASLLQELLKRVERLEKQLQTLHIGSYRRTLEQERDGDSTCKSSPAPENSYQNDVYTV